MRVVSKKQRARQNELRRKPSADKPSTAKLRECMTCRRPFMSEGSHNRICVDCKTSKSADIWNWG